MSSAARAACLFLCLWLGACASLSNIAKSDPPHALSLLNSAEQDCMNWYTQLDEMIRLHRANDAMHTRIRGFPFLRLDRLLASFAGQAMSSEQVRFWIEQMRIRDASSRAFEIQKLPVSVDDRTDECGKLLVDAVMRHSTDSVLLRELAIVPDDYSILMRTLGLYPLTRWPFIAGVRNWQNSTLARFESQPATESANTLATRIQRYSLPMPPIENGELTELMVRSRNNPLGIPLPVQSDLDQLFAQYAPVLDIEVNASADRPGLPGFADALSPPSIDTSQAIMTVRAMHTRVGDSILLQLAYTAWFSERPKAGWFDLLGGRIDGLTWRVTLDQQGRPWVFDSIHACGCYHQFFPGPSARVREQASADRFSETVFVPKSLARVTPGERVVLRVAASTHYLQNVSLEPSRDLGQSRVGSTLDRVDSRYQLIDEDTLRALRANDGSIRSWYGPDGLVAGTERGERFLFWPMGIASAGAMRQTGRQATAFVGNRHFDDADLFERYFEMLN